MYYIIHIHIYIHVNIWEDPKNSYINSLSRYLCVKVRVVQLRPTLCDPMDYTVHGILRARILEWVAVPFFRGTFQPRD